MTDPRIPRKLLGHHAADTTTKAAVDPLGWCVIATTALLTWIIGPVVLAVFSAVGFMKYWRAWRSGASDTRCVLGDVRIVLVYLASLLTIGVVAAVLQFT